MVVQAGRQCVEAHLECVVVVRVDPKVGEEAVDHEVDVLLEVGCAPRERFLVIEEQVLEIIDDSLDEVEDDVVAVEDVNVGRGLQESSTNLLA